MDKITIYDKDFGIFISHDEILAAVLKIAEKINNELAGKDVIALGILNGAFMFASDLVREFKINCRVSFLKVVSYQGDVSSGNVNRLIGLNEDIHGKTVLVIEDIVDSGLTMDTVLGHLQRFKPEGIKVAALLLKPEKYNYPSKVDYVGFEIPNDFVIGYGLDYNGYGRNLKDIYRVINH
ncbi:MAG: hypoxanthine phosphoribosyltransferase [Bacteroidales bacterium]|nr:hypoxanthine phosphoribosyltransferase [Bacteroidales bacterium]